MKQIGKSGLKELRFLLIVFLALVMMSCASASNKEQKLTEQLSESVDAFENAFRWEDYSQAAIFVPAAKKERFWAQVDKFKGKIRLTEFEVRDVDSKDCAAAIVIVRFQYWRTDSPTLKNATVTQKWYYNEKEKHWTITDTGLGAISGF